MGKKILVRQDHEGCIGCAACVSECSKFWKMGKDGKAEIIGGKNYKITIEEKDLSCNKAAESICPVNVIHVEEIK